MYLYAYIVFSLLRNCSWWWVRWRMLWYVILKTKWKMECPILLLTEECAICALWLLWASWSRLDNNFWVFFTRFLSTTLNCPISVRWKPWTKTHSEEFFWNIHFGMNNSQHTLCLLSPKCLLSMPGSLTLVYFHPFSPEADFLCLQFHFVNLPSVFS